MLSNLFLDIEEILGTLNVKDPFEFNFSDDRYNLSTKPECSHQYVNNGEPVLPNLEHEVNQLLTEKDDSFKFLNYVDEAEEESISSQIPNVSLFTSYDNCILDKVAFEHVKSSYGNYELPQKPDNYENSFKDTFKCELPDEEKKPNISRSNSLALTKDSPSRKTSAATSILEKDIEKESLPVEEKSQGKPTEKKKTCKWKHPVGVKGKKLGFKRSLALRADVMNKNLCRAIRRD